MEQVYYSFLQYTGFFTAVNGQTLVALYPSRKPKCISLLRTQSYKIREAHDNPLLTRDYFTL